MRGTAINIRRPPEILSQYLCGSHLGSIEDFSEQELELSEHGDRTGILFSHGDLNLPDDCFVPGRDVG